MFYAHFVLSKKGPLARIWLAAHWDKKLTKAHVFETNIEGSVEAIIQPKVKLALRTSGHLLLGVVRIYSRKAKYLLADCNEAFVKIKMAFRPGVVDLPEENREAAMSAITLAEAFHEFDSTMADLNDIDVHAQFAVNQSRPEEITMREELGNITLVGDDGFGDMGFDGPSSLLHDAGMDDGLFGKDPSRLGADGVDIDFDDPGREAAFSAGFDDYEGPAGADDDDDDNDADSFGGGELFGDNFVGEAGGLFEDPIANDLPMQTDDLRSADPFASDIVDPTSQPPLPSAATVPPEFMDEGPGLDDAPPALLMTTPFSPMSGPPPTTPGRPPSYMLEPVPPAPDLQPAGYLDGGARGVDQTTLLPDDSEAFALEPIDVNTMGPERKMRKKRKLIIDDQKAIASETMKLQLSDSSDIVTTLDLAPPTKKLMHWKETGGVEKLFAFPGRPIVCRKVARLFSLNLVTKSATETAEGAAPDQNSVLTNHSEPLERVRRGTLAGEERGASRVSGLRGGVEGARGGADESAVSVQEDAEERLLAMRDMPQLPLATHETFGAPMADAPSIIDDSRASFPPALPDLSRVSLAPPELTQIDAAPDFTTFPSPGGSRIPPSWGGTNRTPAREAFLSPPHLAEGSPPPPPLDAVAPHSPAAESLPSLPPYGGGGGSDEDDDGGGGGGYEDEDVPEVSDVEGEEEDAALEPVEGEAAEQAEERRWNKRSQQMLHVLERVLHRQPSVTFQELVARNDRKQAASKFYTFLVMKKLQAIDVSQPDPYGDIVVTKGKAFDASVS